MAKIEEGKMGIDNLSNLPSEAEKEMEEMQKKKDLEIATETEPYLDSVAKIEKQMTTIGELLEEFKKIHQEHPDLRKEPVAYNARLANLSKDLNKHIPSMKSLVDREKNQVK